MKVNEQLKEITKIKAYNQLVDYVKKHTDFNNDKVELKFMLKIYEGMESMSKHITQGVIEQEIEEQITNEDLMKKCDEIIDVLEI